MSKLEVVSNLITEHIFEIQHEANGVFLDKKGQVADLIRESGIFPDWQIDANGIRLYNAKSIIKEKEAVINYNIIRFTVFDSNTKNYFEDQTEKFLKILQNSKLYNIPDIKRFGVRTKCFVPCDLAFEGINKKICNTFFNETALNVFGGQQKDLQIIIEIKEKDFQIKFCIGPVKKEESSRYFGFKSEKLSPAGIYIDIDCFKNQKINSKSLKQSIDESMKITWNKISILLDSIGV